MSDNAVLTTTTSGEAAPIPSPMASTAGTTQGAPKYPGIKRHFTTAGVDPFTQVAWEERTAAIA